jgi:hypothetical protein
VEVTSIVCAAPVAVTAVVVKTVGSADPTTAAAIASETVLATAIAVAVVGGATGTDEVDTVVVVTVVEALDDVVKLAPAVLESFAAVDVVAVVLPAKTSKLQLEKANEPNNKYETFLRVCFSEFFIFFWCNLFLKA